MFSKANEGVSNEVQSWFIEFTLECCNSALDFPEFRDYFDFHVLFGDNDDIIW